MPGPLPEPGRHFEDLEQVSRCAQATAHTIGDQTGEASAWTNLGLALVGDGQRVGAVEAVRRAVELFEAAGDEHRAALIRELLALIRQEPDVGDPA